MHIHSRRLIKNVNISAGARNYGEKTLKYKFRKIKTKTYGDVDKCSLLGLTNLVEFIFFSIIDGW